MTNIKIRTIAYAELNDWTIDTETKQADTSKKLWQLIRFFQTEGTRIININFAINKLETESTPLSASEEILLNFCKEAKTRNANEIVFY